MTPRSLQTVFRSLAEGSAADDAELLRRFLGGDERAFGELVRRHGRLVWAACCHLTRSEFEADDAFQATFVVLLKNARRVRDPARLSVWLYGAAYKVCANARKTAARRAARERRVATAEGNGHAVPAAAWDRTLAAVHEEVPRLPETLRIPFVLCCLEGVPPSEAARRLGWNPSTLSVRLSRAKDALLARLDARGLTLGAVVGLGLVAPPTAAVARAAALAHAGAIVPASLLALSHGVVGMSVNPVKALAAAVVVAVGVGGTVGSGWMAPAGAQGPGGGPPPAATPADPPAELRALRAQLADVQRKLDDATAKLAQSADAAALARLRAEAALAREQAGQAEAGAVARFVEGDPLASPAAGFTTPRNEYALVMAGGLDATTLQKLVLDHEGRGWEFAGTAPLKESTACVFRRPVGRPAGRSAGTNPLSLPGSRDAPAKPAAPAETPPPAADSAPAPPPPAAKPAPGTPPPAPRAGAALPALGTPPPPAELQGAAPMLGRLYARGMAPAADSAAAIEAEIERLTAKLKALKPAPAAPPLTVAFNKSSSAFEPETLAQVLSDLGRKKYGTGGTFTVSVTNGVVTVFGDQEVIDWATGLVKRLKGN